MSKEEYVPLTVSDDGDDFVGYRDSENDDNHAAPPPPRRTSKGLIAWLPTLVVFLVSVALAAFGGYWYGRSQPHYAHGSIVDPSITPQSFSYNRTMAEAPTKENDAMWEEMFPPHGGFFHHDTLAPHGASLAAFHQLHCLNGIRHAYWAAHDALVENRTLDFDALPEYSQPWHTRHCIDFLRQMLMCNADITIEYVKPELGGIVGFGVEHQCRDWSQLYNWVRDKQIKWENRPDRNGTGTFKHVAHADEHPDTD